MKRILVAALFVAAAAAFGAEPQTWQLGDGRAVTVVKVLSQNATHVTVRTADGILQIDKRQLPEALQPQYPYDHEAAEAERSGAAERAAQVAEAPAPRTVRKRPAAQPSSGNAVSILSVRPAGRATVFVMVANESAQMVEVNREMFVCANTEGRRFLSMRLTNAQGDNLVRVRIPAGKTVDVGVIFDIPEGEGTDIGAVDWRR